MTHVLNRLCLRRPAVLFGLLSSLFIATLFLQWTIVPATKKSEYSTKLSSALSEDGINFVLNGEKIRIISGAVHYFRMPEQYWRDRLMKLKAIGANTVETYCPWNAHEPKPNKFDFTGNLDLVAFLQLAASLQLYVILRPGPYICSEWDFGGLPAWLLADPNMKIRSNYHGYAYPAKRYLKKIYEITKPFMATTNQGPIIMIQIENEYADYPPAKNNPGHLRYLEKIATDSGIQEKFITSDGSWHVAKGGYDDVLKTVNLADVGKGFSKINHLTDSQPDRPMMVMEFWSGWFDHWSYSHESREAIDFERNLEAILDYNDGSSVNIYMFFGGTNFGFYNGANTDPSFKKDLKTGQEPLYQSTVTSYDYDALLTENGHMTDKFYAARRVISDKLGHQLPPISHLTNSSVATYSKPILKGYCSLWDMLRFVNAKNFVKLDQPVAMEFLPIHKNTGQSFGYTLYETIIDVDTTKPVSLEGFKNNYRDRATVYQNRNKVASFDQNSGRDSVMFQSRQKQVRLQILTENAGRVNYGDFLEDQRKGLFSPITTKGKDIFDWKIYALEFDSEFMSRVNYTKIDETVKQKAGLWHFEFFIESEDIICDTFIDTSMLDKGIVFVNGRNLGRYWRRGPTVGLFCPGVWLRPGLNEIIIFEEMEIIMADRGVDFMMQLKYIDIL